MNTPTKVCLGVSAALLVASAGGMTAANACPETDAPACDVAPAAPETPLLRVAVPSGVAAPSGVAIPSGVSIASGVAIPSGVAIASGVAIPSGVSIPLGVAVLTPDAPRPVGSITIRDPGQSTAWTFEDENDATREVTIVSNEGGEKYAIRMKNGDVVVKRNGEVLDSSRFKVHENQVVILDARGDKLREFQIRPQISAPAAPGVIWQGDGDARFAVRASDAPRAMARVSAPKVMVGIHQSDVPAAVRWHLGLGDDTPAMMVDRVIEGLPADRAGLRSYDVIVSVEGSDGASGQTLSKVLREKNPGDEIKLFVISKGDKKKIRIELDEYDQASLGGGIGFAPNAAGRIYAHDGGEFVFDGAPNVFSNDNEFTVDVESDGGVFDFRFNEHDIEFNDKLHEEINRKREAILEQFEHQSHLEHRDHEKARIALEKAMVELDINLAERVEIAERQAQEARKHVMELRGNRLVLPEKFSERAAELRRRSSEGLEGRMERLEERLEEMHVVLEHQMEQMMERMSRMLNEIEHEMHEEHER